MDDKDLFDDHVSADSALEVIKVYDHMHAIRVPCETTVSATLSEAMSKRFSALQASSLSSYEGSIRVRLEAGDHRGWPPEDLFVKCFELGLWLLESVVVVQAKEKPGGD